MALRDRLVGSGDQFDRSTSRSPIPAPPTKPGTIWTTRRTSEPGRRARLPIRHRIGDGRLAGRTSRTGGHQLPQHHTTGVLRTVEQRHHPTPGRRPVRAGRLAPRAALGIAVSRFDERGVAAGRLHPDPGDSRWPRCRCRRSSPIRATLERLRARRPGRRIQLVVGRAVGPQQGPPSDHRRPLRGPGDLDPDAHLTLVGAPSEPAYARALRRYAASLGLTDAVEFVSGHHRRRVGRPLPARRCAGHALRPRGVRRAPGRSDAGRASRSSPSTPARWARSSDGAGVLLADKHPRQRGRGGLPSDGRPGRTTRLVAAGRPGSRPWAWRRRQIALVEASGGVASRHRPPGDRWPQRRASPRKAPATRLAAYGSHHLCASACPDRRLGPSR